MVNFFAASLIFFGSAVLKSDCSFLELPGFLARVMPSNAISENCVFPGNLSFTLASYAASAVGWESLNDFSSLSGDYS